MSKDNNSDGGWFFPALGLLFIGLKLAEIGPVAAWSWWWVTAPLWGPLVLILAIVLVIGMWAFYKIWGKS